LTLGDLKNIANNLDDKIENIIQKQEKKTRSICASSRQRKYKKSLTKAVSKDLLYKIESIEQQLDLLAHKKSS
jgi:hypothetical protein